jgi:hypothetical protein
MNKLEYWFLDTAVEEVIGFSWIVPDERYGNLLLENSTARLSC